MWSFAPEYKCIIQSIGYIVMHCQFSGHDINFRGVLSKFATLRYSKRAFVSRISYHLHNEISWNIWHEAIEFYGSTPGKKRSWVTRVARPSFFHFCATRTICARNGNFKLAKLACDKDDFMQGKLFTFYAVNLLMWNEIISGTSNAKYYYSMSSKRHFLKYKGTTCTINIYIL